MNTLTLDGLEIIGGNHNAVTAAFFLKHRGTLEGLVMDMAVEIGGAFFPVADWTAHRDGQSIMLEIGFDDVMTRWPGETILRLALADFGLIGGDTKNKIENRANMTDQELAAIADILGGYACINYVEELRTVEPGIYEVRVGLNTDRPQNYCYLRVETDWDLVTSAEILPYHWS